MNGIMIILDFLELVVEPFENRAEASSACQGGECRHQIVSSVQQRACEVGYRCTGSFCEILAIHASLEADTRV